MKYWNRSDWLNSGTKVQREEWAKQSALCWVLEYQPTILLPGKGLIPWDPWPFQQDFMRDQSRFRAINKPRQCGISTTAAAEAAWEFDNVPGAQIVIISKDQDAAINFHKYVRTTLFSIRKNNKKAPKIIKDNERETTNALGNRIVSLAASKESGRSFSATHLFFDELAFIQYADDIWQAASATLAQTRGRVTAISTPKGRANLFYRIFDDPGDPEKGFPPNMGFKIFSYAWWDVPTYNPFYDEYIAAETQKEKDVWIEKAKTGEWYRSERPKHTPLSWAQEFEGVFDASAGSVFTKKQMEVFKKNWLTDKSDEDPYLAMWHTSEKQDNHMYATGVDLARKNDPTVILTYDYTTYPAYIVDFKYIEPGTAGWDDLQAILIRHYEHWEPIAQHDGTGSGDAITEAISSYSDPISFTKDSKKGMIWRAQHAMDHRMVRMPKINPLFYEHLIYIWEDKEIVQDTVMANILALNCFYVVEDAFIGSDNFDFVGSAM